VIAEIDAANANILAASVSAGAKVDTVQSTLIDVRQLSRIAAGVLDGSAAIVSQVSWDRIGEATPTLVVHAISTSQNKPNLSIQVTKQDSAGGAPVVPYTYNMQTTADAFSYRVDPATPNIGGASESNNVLYWEHKYSLQIPNTDYLNDLLTANIYLNDGTFTYYRSNSISGIGVIISVSGFATSQEILGASEYLEFVSEKLSVGGMIDSMTACYVSSATLTRATAGEYSPSSRFVPPASLYAISWKFLSGDTETVYWDYDESPGTRQRPYWATREDYFNIDPEIQAGIEGVTLTTGSITGGG